MTKIPLQYMYKHVRFGTSGMSKDIYKSNPIFQKAKVNECEVCQNWSNCTLWEFTPGTENQCYLSLKKYHRDIGFSK